MAFTNAAKETAADSVTDLGNWIGLATADPGTTGANEASGGGYARKQTTWAAGSSDGSLTGSEVEIDVPAGTFTHTIIRDAESGGTFIGGLPLSSPVVMASGGKIRVTPTVTVS